MSVTEVLCGLPGCNHPPCVLLWCCALQCEQTQDNKGCTTVGVCGKTPEVAGLQVGMCAEAAVVLYPYVVLAMLGLQEGGSV